MTPREAFIVGFLTKCAEEGLPPEEIEARAIEKTALMKSAILGAALNAAGNVASGGVKALSGAASYALPLLLFGPPAAGAATGYALSKLEDDNFDVQDAQIDEQIREWNNAIEHLRSLQKQEPLSSYEEEGE